MTKVAVLGLTGVLLGLMMKELNPGFSVFVSMAACVLIFFYVVNRLSSLGSDAGDSGGGSRGRCLLEDSAENDRRHISRGFHGESMPGCGLFRHRGAGGIFREDFSSDLKLSCAYGTDGNH